MPLQAAATDAAIYSRYDSADVAVFQVARDFPIIEKFRDVFGMGFLALEDVGNTVYNAYRVPYPESPQMPYPQDYVIDQGGIIRYWSWEYDPQVIIATIDSLLELAGVPGDGPSHDTPTSQADIRLSPPAPNPFQPATDVRFWLAARTRVRLAVYGPAGRLVRVLDAGERGPGECIAAWDGMDESGHKAASGVYFIEISTPAGRQTRRAVLLR
ncbi:MAG: FlgD immunoglobulin-like domain containing protein [Candidatus Eisenbacteria bacterium]